MSRRLDYSAARARARAAAHGAESVDGGLPAGLGGPPRRRPSKAEQRRQIEEALAAFAPTMTCAACGRTGPAGPALGGQRLRCPKCGALAEAGRP